MPDSNSQFTLVRASRLIDGKGGPPLERGAILFDNELIVSVGTEEAVAPPEGAPCDQFDYPDMTILPGLVDCHVHLIGIGDGRMGDELTKLPDEVLTLQAARNARAHLYSGVTTVRDCGAKNRTTFMLRQAALMGITPTPRLVLSGRPMAIVGGHLSYFGIEATGEVECRAAVRQLIKEGADFIKITATGGSTRTSHPLRPSFNVDEMIAIVDEAHKFGKHAAAHCASSEGMNNALEAGIDTIIHGYHKDPDGSYRYRPEITDRIARDGVFVNPTLHQGRDAESNLNHKADTIGLTKLEQSQLAQMRGKNDTIFEHTALMREAGVRLVCGSDASWSYYKLGDFQSEIEAHIDTGMSPGEAIVSATSDSARSCWIDNETGSLEKGKQADLLVVDGDPSTDIKTLRNVVDVFQAGMKVDRENKI